MYRSNHLSIKAQYTVLKPVPGSGSRANFAQFHGSSDVKHVSSFLLDQEVILLRHSLLMDQVPVFLPMEPRLAPYGRPL